MPAEKYMKITYHCENGKRINAYLKMPSPTFAVLQREIHICLFDERKLPRNDLKMYWIDEDGDEIEIYNQCDYEIFVSKRSERQHMQVAPLKSAEAMDSQSINGGAGPFPADDPTNFVIHERIECDACNAAPIVGFRYKCIQCPNYDLCQSCEAQHKHAEHMMVRMPNENCPTVIESWVTGARCGRRASNKRTKGNQCPFSQTNGFYGIPTAPSQPAQSTENRGTGSSNHEHKEQHHHGRKHHHHRSMRHGVFSHLYDVMQHFAEGGAANRNQEYDVNTVINNATKTAHEAAVQASAVVAKVSQETAADTAAAVLNSEPLKKGTSKVPEDTEEAKENELNENVDNGATTNTTQSTVDGSESNASETYSKQSVKTTAEGTLPVLPPAIENLVQFVDPQYMKAGIQILNNFSEMFAKMLDPMDDSNAGVSCPFQAEIKNSSALNADSMSSPIKKSVENSTVNNSNPNAKVEETSAELLTQSSDKQDSPDHHSQSEENDWQLIDKQPNISNESLDCVDISISNSTSTESIDNGNTADAAAVISAASSTQINYEQLSKDLKAHVDKELERQKEEHGSFIENSTTSNTINTPSIASTTGTVPKKNEDKRTVVYHTDHRINEAVHAMMSMGFSNEGAWLTQLLESVSGNIAEALDIMSAAQRYK